MIPRVLAVASGGGHWVQLLRLRPAFDGAEVTFVTVRKTYELDVQGERFYVVRDASRWNKIAMIIQVLQLAWIVLRQRPQVVISTGAAPGYWAIKMGKMIGAKTCWIDSIANVETVSLSGQMAGKIADHWLTQWEELATASGPAFRGSVIDTSLSEKKEEHHGHSPTPRLG